MRRYVVVIQEGRNEHNIGPLPPREAEKLVQELNGTARNVWMAPLKTLEEWRKEMKNGV